MTCPLMGSPLFSKSTTWQTVTCPAVRPRNGPSGLRAGRVVHFVVVAVEAGSLLVVEPSAALLELSLLRLRHPDFAGRAKFAKQDDGGSYVAHFSLQRVQVARAAGALCTPRGFMESPRGAVR